MLSHAFNVSNLKQEFSGLGVSSGSKSICQEYYQVVVIQVAIIFIKCLSQLNNHHSTSSKKFRTLHTNMKWLSYLRWGINNL